MLVNKEIKAFSSVQTANIFFEQSVWATQVLKEYMVKGFAMNDRMLKEVGGGGYWQELLTRIRDIRSSEKVFYRQILDIYATSLDYDKNAAESIKFFKVVQNKMHYAAHGHTAAEIEFRLRRYRKSNWACAQKAFRQR